MLTNRNAQIVGVFVLLLFPILGFANLMPWKVEKGLILSYLVTCNGVALSANSGVVSRPHWHSTLLLFMIFLGSVAYIRALYTMPDVIGTMTVIVSIISQMLIYSFAVMLAGAKVSSRLVVAMALCGCVFLHLLNMLLWLLGVENADALGQYSQNMGSMFEFLGPRQIFPLSGGMASSALISAVGGLSAMALMNWPLLPRTNIFLKLMLALAYAIGLIGIALVGNRMVALVFIMSTFAMLIGRRIYLQRKVAILVASLYMFPFIYVLVFPLVEYSGSLDWLAVVSRSGDITDVITLSNRVYIWISVVLHYLQDGSEILFGYGAYGQAASGISDGYSMFFEKSYAKPELASPHSTALQLLTDVGMVGLVLFLIIFVLSVRKAQSYHDKQIAGAMTMLLLVFAAFSSIESELAVGGLVGNLFLFFVAYLSAKKYGVKNTGGSQ